jgi:hypothetical protein
MMRRIVRIWLAGAVAVAWMGEAAAVQSNIGQASEAAAASLQWTSPSSLPATGFGGENPFTVCGWIFQTDADYALATGTYSIIEADGILRLACVHTGTPELVQVELLLSDGEVVSASHDDFIMPGGELVHGEWVFVAASWSPPTGGQSGGILTLRSRTSATLAGVGDDGIAGYRVDITAGPAGVHAGILGPDGIRYGAIPLNPTTHKTWKGVRGLYLLSGSITDADFHALFESRSPTSPYFLAENGDLVGAGECLWAPVFHPTTPLDGLSGADEPTPTIAGDAVTETNVVLYNRSRSDPTDPNHWRYARNVTIGEGAEFYHMDPLAAGEPWSTGFLLPRPDEVGLAQYTSGTLGPDASRVALRDYDRPLRLLHGSNSRGVRTSDVRGRTYPEQHSHGFIRAHESDQVGAMNVPVVLSRVSWFGQDTENGGLLWTSGTVERIERIDGGVRSFQRLWSGGNFISATLTIGAGGGVLLAPGARIQLKFHPEQGTPPGLSRVATKLTATDPATLEFYALLHGTDSRITVTAVAGSSVSEQAPPQVGNSAPVTADGPALAYGETVDAADQILGESLWVLEGNHPEILPGQLCLVQSGDLPAAKINMVSEAHIDTPQPGHTTVVFEKPWPDHSQDPVGAGNLVEFAETQVERFTTGLLGEAGPNTHRGVEIENSGGGIIVVFAQAYWVDGVVGELNGPFGRSGTGWEDQLDNAFPGALERMFGLLEPDVVYLYTAAQGTDGASLASTTAKVRDGYPTAEVVWFMPSDIPTVEPEEWDQIATNDAYTIPNDAYGLSVRESPSIGDIIEMAARFGQADQSHYSAQGTLLNAQAGLALMAEDAVIPGCNGDGTGDGVVDVLDFLGLLAAWGSADPRFDFAPNGGDGTVDNRDFLALLGAWGECS